MPSSSRSSSSSSSSDDDDLKTKKKNKNKRTTTVRVVISKSAETNRNNCSDTSDSERENDSDRHRRSGRRRGKSPSSDREKNQRRKHVTLDDREHRRESRNDTKTAHDDRNKERKNKLQDGKDKQDREYDNKRPGSRSKHDKENEHTREPKRERSGRRERSSSARRGKKYRNTNNRSMEAHHMKKRLVHLTGSDKIRANDMDYMDKLRAKIWEEYEEELQRKEEEREENERQRMRRLMARGIIGPEEMRSDKVLWGEYRRNSNIYEQKYRGKRRKKTPRSPRKEVPDKSMRAKSAPQTRQEMKKVGASSGSFGTLRTGSKCHQAGYNDRGDLSRRQSTPARPTTSVGPRSTLSRNFHTGSSTMSGPSSRQSMTSHLSLTSQSVESRRGSASTVGADTDTDSSDYINYRLGARQRRHEHPIVQQMRREQTVSGLYSLAEKACPVELRDKYTSNSKKETKGEEEYAYNPNRKVKIKF